MTTPDGADGHTSRRAFLGRTAGVVGGGVALGLGSEPVAAAPMATVLTWNVYLGSGLGRLSEAESREDVRAIAGDMLDAVDPVTYEARADTIAAEIVAAEADVVALQEAILLRTQTPGDFGEDDQTPAENAVVDFLELIVSALEERDGDYQVAASTVTTDVELPADTQAGTTDLRLTDRDVLLVRDDHDVGETVTDTYSAGIPYPVPGTDRILHLRRGYCRAETTVDGVTFPAVSTHLESMSNRIRLAQAGELVETLPADRPIVLCGDFNSGPRRSSEAYDRLTGSFVDAWAAVGPGTDGVTCCQSTSLDSDRSWLDSRVDHVLYGGDGVRVRSVERVGNSPEDRVTVTRNDEEVRLWPSDHAGVVATLEIPEWTPRPTATPAATPQSTSTEASTPAPTEGAGPGLGVGTAIAGAIGFGLAGVVRSLREDQ